VVCAVLSLVAGSCAETDETVAASRTCSQLDSASFADESGWQTDTYCPAPTPLGCYPYHAENNMTFGDPISLRTASTEDEDVEACRTLLTSLHCRRFVTDEVDLWLGVRDADRLTMQVNGSWYGRDVDTIWHFNPCQPSCLAAVSTAELEPNQQKICDIPASGKPRCLFGAEAHSITFLRAAQDGLIIRLAGTDYNLPAAE
jgi:hypothetical protein